MSLLQAASSENRDSYAAAELSRTRSALDAAETEAATLRTQRDRLQAELQQCNTLGAQAAAMTDSLQKRLDEIEKHGTSGLLPGTEAGTELEEVRTELGELKLAVQNPNVQDTETQRRIAELSAAVAQLSEKLHPGCRQAQIVQIGP